MKAEERENQRYVKSDHCSISYEENQMFTFLEEYTNDNNLKPQNVKILDMGCGSGKIAKIMSEKNYSVFGLDFSVEAIKKAHSIGINAEQCDLDTGIPRPDNAFDVIWAGDIIEHVFDPIGLIKEAFRVLKKDGIILITIPSDVGLISRIKMLFGISHQEQMYMSTGFYKHHTFFTPRLIKFMLNKAGFKIESLKKILVIKNERFNAFFLPSAFFNEIIIKAKK